MSNSLGLSRKRNMLLAEICKGRQGASTDCLKAQLVILDARLGNFEDSRQVLGEIRSNSTLLPDLRRSIWINLAEGLLDYFNNMGEITSDGVRRACALSDASNIKELQAISSAWAAQLSYSTLSIKNLGLQLDASLKNANGENHAALSRSYLVGAQALDYSRRPDLARKWYARSMHHASLDADDITTSAIMHNMAWLRMLNLRQSVLGGSGDNILDRHVLLSADSMVNFGNMTGDKSWSELKPILRAQVLSLIGSVPEALKLYQDAVDEKNKIDRIQSNLLADQAWCFAMGGEHAKALHYSELSLSHLTNEIFVDDRAATHSRIASVMSICGRSLESKRHFDLSKALWESHSIIQMALLRTMENIEFQEM